MNDAGRELNTRIAALVDAGAQGFDPAALQVATRLLERAAQSDAALAEHLHRRAQAHLLPLESAFAAAKTRAEQALAQLIEAGRIDATVADTLRAKIAAGSFEAVQQRVRSARGPQRAPVHAQHEQRTARLTEIARQRGLAQAPRVGSRGESDALASALYRDSASAANARRAVSRARASVPTDAGHYNAQRVGARMLAALSAYPAYLKAQIARLETLGLLQPVPLPPKPTRTRRKPRS